MPAKKTTPHGGARPGAGRPRGPTGKPSRAMPALSIRLPQETIDLLDDIAARRRMSPAMVIFASLLHYDLAQTAAGVPQKREPLHKA